MLFIKKDIVYYIRQSVLKIVSLLFALIIASSLSGQDYAKDEHHKKELNLESHFKHYRIAVVLGHTYIPTHTVEGTETFVLPSIGLDLEYWFSEHWAVGFHNDIELETFKVEEADQGTIIERNYPLIFTLDAIWKTPTGFILVLGPGFEIEERKNLFVFRTGLEYEFEFGDHWDVVPTLIYDTRFEHFNSWTIGIGIGKRF